MKKNTKKKFRKRKVKAAKKNILTANTDIPITENVESKPVSIEQDIVQIDYPKNNEEISIGTGYTVRIFATECQSVEISVNDGEWKPCRNASGYWWFDWDEIEEGRYKLYARMIKDNGEIIVSKRRLCKIA